MCLVLEAVLESLEQFNTEHMAYVIAGISNALIKSYNHHKLEVFGLGKDKSVSFWTAIINQGVLLQFLEKDIEQYGILSVTPKGKEFLENPYELMLYEDREIEEAEDEDSDYGPRTSGGGGDDTLLAMLKDLRKSIAHKWQLAPYVIFQDVSLEDMSIIYPITIDELTKCQGVGEGKARKFGKPFLELIEKYVEENDIVRPEDIVVKSPPKRSANKLYIIQSIDRKLDFEDIADGKGMTMEELLGEIEAIVNSGTRLNIDYYLRQSIDDDKLEDIFDYFRHDAVSDSIEEAQNALGVDYTEEEIRLVRIKFLVDVAN